MKAKAKKKTVKKRKQATTRKKGGQPPFAPTAKQRKRVERAVGLGMTYEEIAMITLNPKTKKGISTRTLQDHFPDELQCGRAKLKEDICDSIYTRAMKGGDKASATLLIFIAKTQYNWREEQKITHEVEANSGVLIAPSTMSPEDFIKAAEARNAAKKSPVEE